ncbi:MAG: SDR family oxidoreductase [Treponema sp.]|jgi:2-deoxy-D-gluconate 3-dehydrogenase|nr:SDR family oxidoreductase [Treponema sp.]
MVIDEFSLKGRIAAVTGANKGLGLSMALALAEAGADIVALTRKTAPELEEGVRSLGRRYERIGADLSRPETMEALAEKTLAAFGHIDILVNNAGVTPVHPAAEYPKEDLDRVFDVNVKSLYLLCQGIGRDMIKRRYGKIINICSIQSCLGGTNVSAYAASKHAAAGITRALANEWGQYGINVNGIAPGFMTTDNTALLRSHPGVTEALAEKVPLKRWGSGEDLKGPVVFLASESSRFVNGHLLIVDGGFIND